MRRLAQMFCPSLQVGDRFISRKFWQTGVKFYRLVIPQHVFNDKLSFESFFASKTIFKYLSALFKFSYQLFIQFHPLSSPFGTLYNVSLAYLEGAATAFRTLRAFFRYSLFLATEIQVITKKYEWSWCILFTSTRSPSQLSVTFLEIKIFSTTFLRGRA